MSVIGRLDDQVEEVIIRPIAQRYERKNQERERLEQSEREEDSKTAAETERRIAE